MNAKDAKTMASKPEVESLQDDLTLKLWEGDDSVKGELLVAVGTRVEMAIRAGYPGLSEVDAEDVVAEAIHRFWIWRSKFDPMKSQLFTMLYRIADHVAVEYRTGRSKSQKAQLLERGVDAEFFQRIEASVAEEDPPDDVGPKPSALQQALAECFAALSDLQRDILQRYADARGSGINAAVVGQEMGDKHKHGVPIPAGTIRTNRSRAWGSLELCMKKKNFDLKALGYIND